MSYNKYPKEMKEAIMARMLEGDETVTDIQRDTGAGQRMERGLYKRK